MSASDNDSYASDGQLSDGVGFNDAPLSMPITSTSSTDLSKTDLIHSLQSAQIQHQALSQDVKELQAENIYLKSLNPSGKSSKEKSSLTKEDEAIAYAGVRFTVMHELWVNRSTLKLECPTDVDTLCPHRYNDLDKREMVIIAEASFVKHSMRLQVAEVEVLLHDPTQPDKRYPLLAPLLFPKRDCSSPDIFKSKLLANYLKAVLFGKSMLSGEALRKHPSKAILWGVSKTTPGMIAMAATVLTFICGPDQMFSDKVIGPSGINWKQRFIQYKYTIL
ncbi:hypothetical protein F5148DRAFT_1289331 [Russula earlei]|uniref:Uncharacterized protein n=1 Tax=Russula earlei TaxID=71964 RepID=A0ACC0TXT3_9AGAM|nr:hypothetical protein F5148DRAFT_1289331 [Russula earlei]